MRHSLNWVLTFIYLDLPESGAWLGSVIARSSGGNVGQFPVDAGMSSYFLDSVG